MHHTYLTQLLIPGNKYLFQTTRVRNKHIIHKKFTGTFIAINSDTLQVSDYYDGKYAECDVLFWTTPIEIITKIKPISFTKNRKIL
jgi:hypothetical protein